MVVMVMRLGAAREPAGPRQQKPFVDSANACSHHIHQPSDVSRALGCWCDQRTGNAASLARSCGLAHEAPDIDTLACWWAQERALLERLMRHRSREDHHPAFQVPPPLPWAGTNSLLSGKPAGTLS